MITVVFIDGQLKYFIDSHSTHQEVSRYL